jgi:AP-2 complex subunit mu-1
MLTNAPNAIHPRARDYHASLRVARRHCAPLAMTTANPMPALAPDVGYALSGLFIVNVRGDVLISRAYRDNVERHLLDAFRSEIIDARGQSRSTRSARRNGSLDAPMRTIGSVTYMFKRCNDVYVVGVTRGASNAMLGFTFLSHVSRLCAHYFGACTENAIRSNFVLLYELLDEICDNGYPQITAAEVLKTYITQRSSTRDATREQIAKQELADQRAAVAAAKQVTGAVQWRQEGLVYKKNQVYLDIVESVNMMMSVEGTVLRASVAGAIYMKTFLTGMPNIKVGLNDRLSEETRASARGVDVNASAATSKRFIELDDLQFHQCVRLNKFSSEKTIEFTPPDGEFELVRYRVSDGITLPFKLMPAVKELGRTRLAVTVNLKSLYSDKTVATEVRVRIPVPKHTARAIVNATGGKAKYVPEENCLRWKIKRCAGHEEFQLDAEVILANTLEERKPWVQPPINVEFQVPMFTASGLRVRFLEVTDTSGYDVVKWVRYLCTSGGRGERSGSYEIRCA